MSVRTLRGVSHKQFQEISRLERERERLENDKDKELCPEVRMFLQAKIENITRRLRDVRRN